MAILDEHRELVQKRTEDFEAATNLAHRLNTLSTDLNDKLKLVRHVSVRETQTRVVLSCILSLEVRADTSYTW